jgi:putative transcriptional regulator
MFQYYKLFDYMRKNNIRQKDLLDKKIISNGTLQKLRNNENVNTSVLSALCDYLECDITDILEYIRPTDKKGQ